MAIDGILLSVFAIALLMLIKLCFFHVYLCKMGVTTYDLILKKRNKNKVKPLVTGVVEDKSGLMFRKMKKISDDDNNRPHRDDSRDAMNMSLNKSYQSHRPVDLAEREDRDTFQSDPTKIMQTTKTIHEHDTAIKNKEMFATKEEMASKLDDDTRVHSGQSTVNIKPPKQKDIKSPLDPLKEDEGSFVLSKPVNQQEKHELSLRLSQLLPKLTPPMSVTNRNLSDEETPGDWTLRNRQQNEKQ